jgi:hypothetical protein
MLEVQITNQGIVNTFFHLKLFIRHHLNDARLYNPSLTFYSIFSYIFTRTEGISSAEACHSLPLDALSTAVRSEPEGMRSGNDCIWLQVNPGSFLSISTISAGTNSINF